jgi:hypothetical protein
MPNNVETLKIHPSRLHHLMAFSKLIVSDGQTMCSEASCLGVPSIRINDFVGRISYLEQQEKRWNLTFGIKPSEFYKALKIIDSLVKEDSNVFKERRDKMIESSLNMTNFLIWIIENYPESKKKLKENPDFQYQFK